MGWRALADPESDLSRTVAPADVRRCIHGIAGESRRGVLSVALTIKPCRPLRLLVPTRTWTQRQELRCASGSRTFPDSLVQAFPDAADDPRGCYVRPVTTGLA